MMTLGAIVAGFILDLIFGDPHWLPHPICLIGNLIGFLDKKLRRMLAPGETALLLGGALMLSIGVVGEYVGKMYMEVKGRPRYLVDEIRSRSKCELVSYCSRLEKVGD